VVEFGAFRREGIGVQVGQLLTRNAAHPPTALFAANDLMAIEAILALTRLGYRVPDDIAVCGFDDIPEARLVIPALASVSQNEQGLGAEAAACLIERLGDSDMLPAPRQIIVPHTVILRESIGERVTTGALAEVC
jgi:LacI family transcriptional regulator